MSFSFGKDMKSLLLLNQEEKESLNDFIDRHNRRVVALGTYNEEIALEGLKKGLRMTSYGIRYRRISITLIKRLKKRY